MADQNIIVKIGADTKALNSGLRNAEGSVQKFANGLERAAQGPRAMLYGLMKSNPILGVAGGLGLFSAMLIGVVTKFATFYDSIQKQADAIGIEVDAFQRFSYAAAKTGVQVERVMNMMTRFNLRLEEAKNGNLAFIKSFDNIGISVDRLSKMTPDKAFNTMITRIRELKNEGKDISRFIEDMFGRRSIQDINKLVAGNFESEQENAKIISNKAIAIGTDVVNSLTNAKNSLIVFAEEIGHVSTSMVILKKILDAVTSIPGFAKKIRSALYGEDASQEEPQAFIFDNDRQYRAYKEAEKQLDFAKDNQYTSLAELEEKYAEVDKKLKSDQTRLSAAEANNPESKDSRKLRKELSEGLESLQKLNDEIEKLKKSGFYKEALEEEFKKIKDNAGMFGFLTTDEERYMEATNRVIRRYINSLTTDPKIRQALELHAYGVDFPTNGVNESDENILSNLDLQYKTLVEKSRENYSLKANLEKAKRDYETAFAYEAYSKYRNEAAGMENPLSFENFLSLLNGTAEAAGEWQQKYIKGLQDEIALKKEEMRLKQKDFLENLKKSTPPVFRDEKLQQAADKIRESFEKVGITNQDTLGLADDLGRLDWILRNSKLFSPEDNKITTFTNDLASRGGFNSSVVMRVDDKEGQILDFVKLISTTETTRNKLMNDILKTLGE